MRALATVLILAASSTVAAADCPSAVTDAVKKAFPDASVTKCVAEGKGFEVKLARKGAKLEVDVSAAGEILMVEEPITIAELPAAVTKAMAAKYPKARASKAEKQTARKEISYEVDFVIDGTHKEATFKQDGTFVEEE